MKSAAMPVVEGTPAPLNVLLIMSDQHHKRILGCAGDPLVRTPALDGLAARGVRFGNASCTYPLCVPSRASFLACRHPHELDVYTNNCEMRTDRPTFAHAFLGAGYETVLAGRMHFLGVDQRHGFATRLVGDVWPTAYPSMEMLRRTFGDLAETADQQLPGLLRSGPGRTGGLAYDECVAGTAAAWLRQRGNEPRRPPFLLTVGLFMPHCPFVAPAEDFFRCWPEITAGSLPRFDPAALHAVHRVQRRYTGVDAGVPLEVQRRVRAAYYGMVAHLDRQVGRVLEALEASGLAGSTLVVYTSDHGEQLGEHGLWWKSTFYEGSVGVPLIVSRPGGRRGAVVRENVSLMDVGVTLLDLAGARALPGATGRSFARLLREGHDPDWPDEVFAEYNPRHETAAPCQRMIRRGPWKLNTYLGHPSQLFNLDEDPLEENDRINDPACADRVSVMTARVHENWDPQRIARLVGTRTGEFQLLRSWQRDSLLPEPDPPWFGDAPPDNILDVAPV